MRDNQKIHLDELFRERFQNESDREQIHSSWKKMEALLDEEKDKRRFVLWRGLNWLVPAMLISLTGAGIGYWTLQKNNEDATNSQQLIAQNTPQNEQAADPVSLTETKDNAPGHSQNIQQQSTRPKTSDVAHIAQNMNNNFETAAPTSSIKAPAKNKSKQKNNAQQITIQNETDAQLVGINDEGKITTKPTQKLDAHASRTAMQQALPTISPELEQAALAGNLVVDRSSGEVKKQTLRKVRGILVSERPHKDPNTKEFTVTRDTIGYPEVEKLEYIALSSAEIRELQKVSLLQIAGDEKYDLISIERPSPEPKELVASTSHKGISRKKSGADKEKSTSILRDVNNYFQIKNNFYFTVFGGLNVSPPSMFPIGFQVSPGVHYLLGSRWSIGAELGYAYRPMSYTFTDEALTYTQHGPGVPVSSGVRFDYREEKNSNTYNFRYLNTFDLPLILSYETEKWAVFGGPSMHFTSKLRYQKLSSFEAMDKSVILPDSESFDMTNTTLQSTPEDFSARMGFGVLMGVKYSLTDRLGLTFRYSQVLTDQSNTNLGVSISKETFRLPSFRLGVTYRLNRDKRVKYMLGQ